MDSVPTITDIGAPRATATVSTPEKRVGFLQRPSTGTDATRNLEAASCHGDVRRSLIVSHHTDNTYRFESERSDLNSVLQLWPRSPEVILRRLSLVGRTTWFVEKFSWAASSAQAMGRALLTPAPGRHRCAQGRPLPSTLNRHAARLAIGSHSLTDSEVPPATRHNQQQRRQTSMACGNPALEDPARDGCGQQCRTRHGE